MLGILILLVVTGLVLQSFSLRDRWGFRISDSIEYSRHPKADHTEPGEPVELETLLINHSKLPIFQLNIREPLPKYAVLKAMNASDYRKLSVQSGGDFNSGAGLFAEENSELCSGKAKSGTDVSAESLRNQGGRLEVSSDGYQLSGSVYLGGRQILRRRTLIEFPMRGVYDLGKPELYHGDFIGFAMKKIKNGNSSEVVVYPEKIQDHALAQSVIDYLGEVQRERTLYEDSLSTRSYRDYTTDDPMKLISWKQSAKAGRLIVREFDRLGDDAVTLVFDLSYVFDGERNRYISLLEYGYSLSRTFIETLIENGSSFAFMTNAHTPDKKTAYRIVAGRTPLPYLLEILGRTKSMALFSTHDLLRQAAQENKAMIYIGLTRTPEVEKNLDALYSERGIRTLRIYADERLSLTNQNLNTKYGNRYA